MDSIITWSCIEGYTTKGQGDQIGIQWGLFVLFNRTRGERTSVGGVVGHIGKRIALVFLKQPPPTQILANLLTIVRLMAMM
jgi:hypothetical protein